MTSRQVRCPRCGNSSIFSSENPSRPFCSERCKLIDLGDWASENFRIPDKENVLTDFEGSSEDETQESDENPRRDSEDFFKKN